MTEFYKVDDELIDNFLRGKLEQEGMNDFEVRLLEDPQLFEAVQMRKAMIEALDSESSSLLAEQSEPQIESVVVDFKQWLRQPYSMAASLIAALSVTLLVGNMMPGEESDSGGQSVLVASNLILETVRGNDQIITSSGTGPILLTIDVGPVSADARFDIIITDEEGGEVFSEESAGVDDQGWLRVVLARSFSGLHRISVFAAGSSEPLQSTSIEFIP